MKFASLLVLVTLAAPLPAQSSHRWNTAHFVLGSTAVTSVLIDWAQTRQALHQGWAEKNPILGAHPSDGKLALYNLIAIAGTCALGAALPTRLRTMWFGSVALVEAYTIAGNARLGLHVGF